MQVVDLQESERFQALGAELLSVAPDSPEDWLEAGREYGVRDFDTVLSDEGNTVATSYEVMQWQAATGEPGHTFVLVDEAGEIAWVKDYGAPEHGGVMWVDPDELMAELEPHL
jgi:peroxiredoxin